MTFLGEEGPGKAEQAAEKPASWKVLITDDEQDVHSATTFALRNTKVMGRRLEFLHANSAEEALKVLKSHDDIAVILLDVVMETPNAGLDLVAVIRNELKNHRARIILRTGQPNQAPEIEVIRDYDINDYKLKSELTQNKLYASLTAAIRSYQQLQTIEASKVGLDQIVRASAELMTKKGIHEFAQGVIVQLAALLAIEPEGLICVRRSGSDEPPQIIAAAGQYCELIDHPLTDLQSEHERGMLQECLSKRQNILDKHGVALYLGSSERGDMCVYVGSAGPVGEVDRSLLELFCSNIAICADNLELIDRLRRFAYRDSLVDLPNSHALNEKIANLQASGELADYALVLAEIDNLAEIRAAHGAEIGEHLLKSVAARLRQSFPEDQVELCRVATNGFALLANKAALSSESVDKVFSDEFQVDNTQLQVNEHSELVALDELEAGDQDWLRAASYKLSPSSSR